ncbi:MAG: hypothetical protein WD688_18950 [Candidatus Binatia bacterium]
MAIKNKPYYFFLLLSGFIPYALSMLFTGYAGFGILGVSIVGKFIAISWFILIAIFSISFFRFLDEARRNSLKDASKMFLVSLLLYLLIIPLFIGLGIATPVGPLILGLFSDPVDTFKLLICLVFRAACR